MQRKPGSVQAKPTINRTFWLTVSAVGFVFAFTVANQIYFSMHSHGHDWWRIVVWQLAGAVTWTLISPLILGLKRRFPFESGAGRSASIHLGAALTFAALRQIPLTAVTMTLDPYLPVTAHDGTFLKEYLDLLASGLLADLFVYGAILSLAYAFDYREQVHRDQLRTSRLETELVNAELRALKLELHPHFLFNVLNSLVGLVRRGSNDRAENMLLALSELLRSTLDGRRRQLVPLTEELEVTRLYLKIQEVRFADRLVVEWHVDPETRRTAVPSLVLQPLVENAIRHAVEPRAEVSTITIRTSSSDGRLVVEIDDDGPSAEVPAAATESHGIGLENVRSRLEALFGDDWDLELAPCPDGQGTRVTLSFTWQIFDESARRAV